ncbi:MAG: 1-deoxy-D-xylulose-5-phosphate reductoisomerase [gamma proteobacterium symbiont of Bathyaustriella thionipta]|nr:1-deoxy-D-xylulose-5-phosphate reductoisomerase [gamma proteobacterium symbiont of Bathyaustriella thionipta]
MKRMTILGSTGSIGVSTLDVISRHADRFEVFALTANTGVAALAEQCRRFCPHYAVMADSNSALQLQKILAEELPQIQVLAGTEGLQRVASDERCDMVMAAIVGAAGLQPALAAARAGKRILLANKEALVIGGPLFMDAVREHAAELLPIDSEHNAIFQCMPQTPEARQSVQQILLTASGGPFRQTPLADMAAITPEQACAHPNWDMGRKISVDSATMMNKGLEVIEASWLFDCKVDDIQIVVHPQSIVHSMVSYVDGSVLAQMGNPDMRTPIAYAMAWPERMHAGVAALNLFEVAQLQFEAPDRQRFPAIRLAYEAAAAGGVAPALLNAANEIAVAAFLERRLGFTDIAVVIEQVLNHLQPPPAGSIDELMSVDRQARALAAQFVEKMTNA